MSVMNRKLALAVSLIAAAAGTAGMSTGAWAICSGKQASFGCKINGGGGPLTQCVPDPAQPPGQKIEAPIAGCLDAFANTGGCVIEGGAGDDILVGSLRNDTICANAGTDMVFAKAGDDTVFMGSNPVGTLELGVGQFGDDLLVGDAGDDVLIGGPGPDRNVGGPDFFGDYCIQALQNLQCEFIVSENP